MKVNNKEIENKFVEGKKILVVNDDRQVLESLQEVLEFLNAEVLLAHHGKEAIKVVQETNNIDLVIMNVKMPQMNGFEATKRIKKINKNLIVVGESGLARHCITKEIEDCGFDDFLESPIELHDLLQVLEKFLKR